MSSSAATGSAFKALSSLHKREKVLVQYRLLRDLDGLTRNPLPGVDIRVQESNIYEWHVTLAPLSGHYIGLKIHMIILFPEDYPKRPPRVGLQNWIPHCCVWDNMSDWLYNHSAYAQGVGGRRRQTYELCTDLLQEPTRIIRPQTTASGVRRDEARYSGWSSAYSVESVLVQLQCLLFDREIVLEDGLTKRNTLWDHYWRDGRRSPAEVCAALHRAQRESDNLFCADCGYTGRGFKFGGVGERGDRQAQGDPLLSEAEKEATADECSSEENRKQPDDMRGGSWGEPEGAAADASSLQPFQNLYEESAEADEESRPLDPSQQKNATGVDLRTIPTRVPGVLQYGDLVSLRFFGVPDLSYRPGGVRLRKNMNPALEIYNFGFAKEKIEFWDATLGRRVVLSREAFSSAGLLASPEHDMTLTKKDENAPDRERKTASGKRCYADFVRRQDGVVVQKGGKKYLDLRGAFLQYAVVAHVDAAQMCCDCFAFVPAADVRAEAAVCEDFGAEGAGTTLATVAHSKTLTEKFAPKNQSMLSWKEDVARHQTPSAALTDNEKAAVKELYGEFLYEKIVRTPAVGSGRQLSEAVFRAMKNGGEKLDDIVVDVQRDHQFRTAKRTAQEVVKNLPHVETVDVLLEGPGKLKCVLLKNVPLHRVGLVDQYREGVRSVWELEPEPIEQKSAPAAKAANPTARVVKSYNAKKDGGKILMRVVEGEEDVLGEPCRGSGRCVSLSTEESPGLPSARAAASSFLFGPASRETCRAASEKGRGGASSSESSFVFADDLISLSDLQTVKSSFVVVDDGRSLSSWGASRLLGSCVGDGDGIASAAGLAVGVAEEDHAVPASLLLQGADFDVWSLGDGDLVSVSAGSGGAASRSDRGSSACQRKMVFPVPEALQANSGDVFALLDGFRRNNEPIRNAGLRNVCEFGAFFALGPKTDALLPFAPWMKAAMAGRASCASTPEQADSGVVGLPNPLAQVLRCKAVLAEISEEASARDRRTVLKATVDDDPDFRFDEFPLYVKQLSVSSAAAAREQGPPSSASSRQRPPLKITLSLLPSYVGGPQKFTPGQSLPGIVVDVSKEKTLGIFVAVSDSLVGLVRRYEYGETAGNVALADHYNEAGLWTDRKAARFRVGDSLQVWVVKVVWVVGGAADRNTSLAAGARDGPGVQSRNRSQEFKLDLSLDRHSPAMRKARWDCLVRPLRCAVAGASTIISGAAHQKKEAKECGSGAASSAGDSSFELVPKATATPTLLQADVSTINNYQAPQEPATALGAKNETETFDYAACLVPDRELLLKHSKFLKAAVACYPNVFSEEDEKRLLDYRTFKFDLDRNEREKKQALEKKLQAHRDAEALRKLPKEERERIEAGIAYYEKIERSAKQRKEWHEACLRLLEAERAKYPQRSVVDVAQLRRTMRTVAEKNYDARTCFVTGLCYKQDVLGVGLEIKPENPADPDSRLAFHCSFDLLSKEAYYDFGIRAGVWGDRVAFWMPAAVDAEHFERGVKYLADLFQLLGNSEVAAKTRSYGTQAGSKAFHAGAQMREALRGGGQICSLDQYRAQQAEKSARLRREFDEHKRMGERPEAGAAPGATASAGPVDVLADAVDSAGTSWNASASSDAKLLVVPAIHPPPKASLTEGDLAFALEVLPKLMNSQVVFLLKGELHHSEKALEGYIGFHHLFLSVLSRFPSLQERVEQKISSFMKSEECRSKKHTPNLGEFLCLLAVSERYEWDDLSSVTLRETLDRNAGWTLDPYPKLACFGCPPDYRLEKTFLASIVSIRLLTFNVWFLRNVVFRGPATSEEAARRWADAQRTPQQMPGISCAMKQRLAEYNRTKGVPERRVVRKLAAFFQKFREGGGGLESWVEYLQYLNLSPVSVAELDRLLVDRLLDAVRKGYLPQHALRRARERAEAEANRRRGKATGAEGGSSWSAAGADGVADRLDAGGRI